MLTIFACPKSFRDPHIATIQRNAITSWTCLKAKPEIILFGRDEGTEEICKELGLRHLPDVKCNEFGTPLISDIFEKAQIEAVHEVLCYVNADIIITGDIVEAVSQTQSKFRRFLLSGQRWGLDLTDRLNFATDWEADLRRRVQTQNELHNPDAIDYFVFSRNLFRNLPEFAVGRPLWDIWLMGHAVKMRVPIVDATNAVMVVHQAHDYAHTQGVENYKFGPEARRNRSLIPKGSAISTLYESTHRLAGSRIKTAWLRRKRTICTRLRWRIRATAKKALVSAGLIKIPQTEI